MSENEPATSFEDLGIPFPLFAGPVEEATEYVGGGRCAVCGESSDHRFFMGIGSAVVVPCPACRAEVGLDTDDGEDGSCPACDAAVPFPELRPDVEDDEPALCYDCLRLGRAALSKGTELGMISWEQVRGGVTHGGPGLNHPDFEMVPRPDSDWVGARLGRDIMRELLRTPSYMTWQGEEWQFCCRSPMVYAGTWSREDFARNAEDGDGEALFRSVIRDDMPGLWEDDLHDETVIYIFECPTCRSRRATWDMG